MNDFDPKQERINEKSYEELLTGKYRDPQKDPRWHAVHGMNIAINIITGKMNRIKKMEQSAFQHIYDYYCIEIGLVSDKKAKLKLSILEKTS